MIGSLIDIFRLRQYFNVITRVRDVGMGLFDDVGFVYDATRALSPVQPGRGQRVAPDPFPPFDHHPLEGLRGTRVALLATGGSGALASVVGVGRALEEAGVVPAAISVCSGSALFGFPLAAGLPAAEVAAFVLSLRPRDYVDAQWARIAGLPFTGGRGFAGILRGDAVEATYASLLGDLTLGDLPVPCYAPIWNVDENRVEYLGPKTHPDVKVARAVRMAIALPLFIEAAELDGSWWCDGGVVDIFPVRPLLDIEEAPEVVVAVNGFYPPGFAGEDLHGWHDRSLSILYAASQVRTCQQVGLARENLARLEHASQVVMLEPVPYSKVRGTGFYRQFFDNSEWGAFMRSGRDEATRALRAAFSAHPTPAFSAS